MKTLWDESPGPSRRRYTLSEVKEMERPAWNRDASGWRYFFDGTYLWSKVGDGVWVASKAPPAEGWWHRRDCTCEQCRRLP